MYNKNRVSTSKVSSGRVSYLSDAGRRISGIGTPRYNASRLTSKALFPLTRNDIVSLHPGKKMNMVLKWLDPVRLHTSWRLEHRLLSDFRSKEKSLRFLILKLLFGEMESEDIKLAIILALELNDSIALKLLKFRTVRSKFSLAARINSLIEYFDIPLKPFRRRELESLKNSSLIHESEEIWSPSPKIIRYTGWARNQNDQGSLRSEDEEEPLPLQVDETPFLKLNDSLIEEVLSVGILPLPREGDMSPLKSNLIRFETDRFLSILLKEMSHE